MATPNLMTLSAYGITNAAELDNNGKILASQLPSTYTSKVVIPASVSGVPADSAVVLVYAVPLNMSIAVNCVGCYAEAVTAATAETVFTVKVNGTDKATITFDAEATVGVFSEQAAISLVAGDLITIHNQANNDATLANIGITLVASLV